MTPKISAVGRGALAAIAVALAVATITSAATGAPPITHTTQATLSQAATIGNEVNTRIRLAPDAGLAVTETTSTDMIDSFTLLSADLVDARFVPAAGGVWYALCPDRASCPYPAPRLARPASDRLARRLALELAVRTFLETDAPVVGISLPTPHFVAVIFERAEITAAVDMASLAWALRAEPLRDARALALVKSVTEGRLPDPRSPLQRTVDELTRPRTYLFLGFEPGPYGPMSWAGMPCWPAVSW